MKKNTINSYDIGLSYSVKDAILNAYDANGHPGTFR